MSGIDWSRIDNAFVDETHFLVNTQLGWSNITWNYRQIPKKWLWQTRLYICGLCKELQSMPYSSKANGCVVFNSCAHRFCLHCVKDNGNARHVSYHPTVKCPLCQKVVQSYTTWIGHDKGVGARRMKISWKDSRTATSADFSVFCLSRREFRDVQQSDGHVPSCADLQAIELRKGREIVPYRRFRDAHWQILFKIALKVLNCEHLAYPVIFMQTSRRRPHECDYRCRHARILKDGTLYDPDSETEKMHLWGTEYPEMQTKFLNKNI